jgi:hypothetical protein
MTMHLDERNRELVTGLGLIAFVALALLGSEAAFRVARHIWHGISNHVEYEDMVRIDPQSGMLEYVPGVEFQRVRINSQGFRGPEIPVEKPPSTVRMAFLGSSTTLGFFLAEADSWPTRVGAALAGRYSGCHFEVINAGFPATRSVDALQQFRHKLARFAPDAVVMLLSGQREEAERRAIEQGLFDGEPHHRSWMARHFEFWANLERRALVRSRRHAGHDETGRVDLSDPALTEAFEQTLSELVGEVRVAGGRPVLLVPGSMLRADQDEETQMRAASSSLFLMPFMSIEGLLDSQRRFDAAIEEVAHETGSLLLRPFAGVPGDQIHFRDSSHLKPAGAHKVGAAVARGLVADPQFRDILAGDAGCIESHSER